MSRPGVDDPLLAPAADWFFAARGADVETLRRMLAEGWPVDRIDSPTRRATALMEVAGAGSPDCLELLLAAGADVRARQCDGADALAFAVDSCARDCVAALLTAGAEPSAPMAGGQTAAMLACLRGHAEVLSLLLAAGAAIDARDCRGRTAAMCASLSGSSECLGLLIQAGADLDAVDEEGLSARDLAGASANGAGAECARLIGAELARREALAIGGALGGAQPRPLPGRRAGI